MSKNNVKVTVKLIDGFSKTLKRLEGQLDKIDKKTVAPKFDFDDNGQIDKLKSELKSIEDSVNVKLNIHGEEQLKKTHANIEHLSGVENIYVKTHDNELTATIAKMKTLRRRQDIRRKFSAQDNFLSNIRDSTQAARKHEGRASRRRAPHLPDDTGPIGAAKRQRARARRRAVRLSMPEWANIFRGERNVRGGPVGGYSGMDFDDLGRRFGGERRERRGFFGRLGQRLRGLVPGGGGGGGGGGGVVGSGDDPSRHQRAASGIFRALVPRGQLTQDMAAFFMPFMFTAYTAAMGAIAAAAAPAIAGISALGLGILGFGENAADSLKLAEVRLRIFGRELHKVFKPAQQTFAPFVDQWFKTLPHTLGRELNQPLQNMVVWMPTVEKIGGGILGWTGDFLNLMNELEPVISRVVMQLGADTGDALLRFFEWLIIELDENYDVIRQTLGAFKNLAIIVYRISVLWGYVVAAMYPVFWIVQNVAKLLSHSWLAPIVGFLGAWALVYAMLVKVTALLVGLKTFLAGGMLAKAAAGVIAWAGSYGILAAAISKAAAAKAFLLGLTGKGLVLVAAGVAAMGAAYKALDGVGDVPTGGGGGMSGVGGGGGGHETGGAPSSVGGNTINIYGNLDNTQVQQFKDMFPEMHEGETHVNNRMSQG